MCIRDRCSFENEYILVKLESSWYVGCDVAVSFKSKILCLIRISKRVSEYFVLSAKIVIYNMRVYCKVLLRMTVSYQNWLTSFNSFTLSFETVIRVQTFNNPNRVECVFWVKGGFLISADSRTGERCEWHTAEYKCLSWNIWIWLKSNFLSETDDVVASENIFRLVFSKYKNASCNRSLILFGSVNDECIINTGLFWANVGSQITVNFLILYHERITTSKEAIFAESPWYGFQTILNFLKCWVEIQSAWVHSLVVISASK
jgi:hypothetical protein